MLQNFLRIASLLVVLSILFPIPSCSSNTEETKTPDALDVARKSVQKKYGDVIKTMSEIDDSGIISVPTGCIGLDAILGRAGIPLGTICEIYGPPSGGKTPLAMNLIAQAQKKGLNCLLIDAERACDPPLYGDL